VLYALSPLQQVSYELASPVIMQHEWSDCGGKWMFWTSAACPRLHVRSNCTRWTRDPYRRQRGGQCVL